MWKYEANSTSKQILDSPNIILNYLKEWLQSQRWAGVSAVEDFSLVEKDEFLLYDSDFNKIIAFLVGIYPRKSRKPLYTYFIPFEIARQTKNETFPVTLQCSDQPLFLRPAESNDIFFQCLLKNIIDQSKIQTRNSNMVEFKQIASSFNDNLEIKSKTILGDGNTTNTLFKLVCSNELKWICKMYRIFSQNPEIKMVMNLYKSGFHHIPQPIGCVSLKLTNDAYPLLFISEFVEASGDGGRNFWNDLTQQINSWNPHQSLSTDQLRKYCETLGGIIAEFHVHSANIEDPFFKPEPISRVDLLKWKRHPHFLFSIAESNILREFPQDVNYQTSLNILKPALDHLLDLKNWFQLTNLRKIKIHQDLHLSQMLTVQSANQSNYILIDFEGDPLLPLEDKFQKDPFFRDLASICSAFHYIKFSALQQYFSTQAHGKINQFMNTYFQSLLSPSSPIQPDSILQLIQFATQWESFCSDAFLDSYIRALTHANFPLNFDFTNLPKFHNLLNLFRVERLIKELYYESLFRKSMIIIPLIGLLEFNRKLI